MSLQTEIKKSFLLTAQDAAVAQELESICNIYSLTPDKLKTKWEAFALTSQCDLKPTVPYVNILKNSLQRDFERGLKSRRTVKGRVTTKRAGPAGMDFSEYGLGIDDNSQDDPVQDFMSNMFGGGIKVTTTVPKQIKVVPLASASLDTQISQYSSQFINRKATHVIETQYNAHLPLTFAQDDDEDMSDIDQEFSFTVQHTIQPYRYMHEKIKEKSEGLDDRIDYIGSLIGQHYNIEAFGNPTRPTQEAIYAYGLVCSDSSDSSKINEKSLVLETSRDLGMGRRISLNLSKVNSYTFFPGQVIGVRGINHLGSTFHVDEVLMPPFAEKITLSPKENKTLTMIVSAGPYTLDDDLSYRPLEELLNMCSQQKPNIMLLMGPFLSIHHPKVANGMMDTLPEHLVREQVIGNLERLLESACPKTHIFLVPHANEMTQIYNLFPQPQLSNLNIKHSRIHLLSNPTTININGHTISLGNTDVLFKLSKEEISKNPGQSDRFTRLVEHLLQQHTYYPLYPHAVGDNIDAERMIDLQLISAPDILILPSQFKHFVKNIGGSVCINPGYLCKHQAGGTYSRVIMYPRESEQERFRVDLLKL